MRVFGFDTKDEAIDRELPPFALGPGASAGLGPLFVALRAPAREGTPLEVHRLHATGLELVARQVVKSNSDAVAISVDERIVAVGDAAEGEVNLYLTGGPAWLRGQR